MWKKHPRRMLWWRTITELVAIMCPEVTMGMTASPDDATTYEPPAAPAAAVTLDRVARRPAVVEIAATEADVPAAVSEGPEPVVLAGSGPAPPGPQISAKRRAQDAVLAGVGGDRSLARTCWDEMVAKGPWPAYPDPAAWAAAWLVESAPQPLTVVDTVEQIAAEQELCGHLSRDGRPCIRNAHDSKNHKYPPVENSEGSDALQPSRPDAITASDPSDPHEDPLMHPDGWDDDLPPGHEPFEPPMAAA